MTGDNKIISTQIKFIGEHLQLCLVLTVTNFIILTYVLNKRN